MADAAIIGSATLALTQTIATFDRFLPPLTEVRRGSMNDPEFVMDVRIGELASIGLTLGVGATASALTKSNVPMIVGIFTAAIMVVVYEMVMRSPAHGMATTNELRLVEDDNA